jgi:isoleucyl-tRNA synthetase
VIDCWFDSGAMPYAQFHYPFEKDGIFEQNFPADFISEGIDQTRGWFYSLLAISTMVSGESSYKSCLSIEMIQDREGRKMSKSKGNAVDPSQILTKEGADPLRWYLFSVSPPWVPTRFDREGLGEVHRKFFGTLANTYGFFVLYANIDQFQYNENAIPVDQRPEIDRWILSMLNSLVKKVDGYLSRYDVTKAARAIQDFVIDDLSNWYVRRNRRRFWKSEMGKDKLAAYQTLYETLITAAKLIAPFAPFLSEDMYCNLNSIGFEEGESVHLAQYPDPKDKRYQFIDQVLEDHMRNVREAVTLCRAARNEAGIRIRQPLERAVVISSCQQSQKAIQAFMGLIIEEVNVRKVEFQEDVSQFMQKRAQPVFKSLGPKFGSQVNQAAEVIRNLTPKEIAVLEKGKEVEIDLGGKTHGEISAENVDIVSEAMEGFIVQSDGDFSVALDISLNEDLVAEGLAREFVNRVQHMRKEAGYEVTDRIHVSYQATAEMDHAIQTKEEYIQQEILAVSIDKDMNKKTFHREWDIEKEKIHINIERI